MLAAETSGTARLEGRGRGLPRRRKEGPMTTPMSDTGLQASMVQGGNAKLMLQGLSREIRVEGLEGFLQGHLSIL